MTKACELCTHEVVVRGDTTKYYTPVYPPALVQEMVALFKAEQASHLTYCGCKTCRLVARLESNHD